MSTFRSQRATPALHQPSTSPHLAIWAKRILSISLFVIIVLTLSPFHFDFSRLPPGGGSPFLLGPFHKRFSFPDFILNVLLFVPFGFGLANLLRVRGRSWVSTFSWVFIGGALSSYLVEFLQIFVPGRDSGWGDVLTNSGGAVVGFFLFMAVGKTLVRLLSRCEEAFEVWLPPIGVAVLVAVYLGAFLLISVPLQGMTRLSDWDANAFLQIGGDRDGRHLWKGQINTLQIWDQALPGWTARRLKAGMGPPMDNFHILVSYDFSSRSPFHDQKDLLPDLLIRQGVPAITRSGPLNLTGSFWLTSRAPVSNLIHRVQSTNQFSVRVVCTATHTADSDGYIVSLVDETHGLDLRLRQQGSALVIWIRNPLSMGQGNLNWAVPHVFVANQVRTILLSYDGSWGYLYVDGNQVSRPFRLGPGASLTQKVAEIATVYLDGYSFIYDSVIFVPLGFLLGFAVRRISKWNVLGWTLLGAGFVVPPLLYEFLLVWVSGRRISVGEIVLCGGLLLLGCVLINIDGGPVLHYSSAPEDSV